MGTQSLVALACALTAIFGAVAAAQDVPALAAGQRVRISAAALGIHNQVGTLLEWRTDTVRVQPARRRTETLRLPRAAITQLDVSMGKRSRIGRGALIGLFAGAAVGAGVGAAVGGGQNGDGGSYAGLGALVFGGIGAAGGLVVGTVIGAATTTDQWRRVLSDGVRVGLAVTPDGRLGLITSISL